MVITPDDSRLKEARDKDNNIIIRYYTLRNILPPQMNQMTSQYKFMYGYECRVSAKSIYSPLLTCCDRHTNQLKDIIHNTQYRSYDKISSRIFDTYKNAVRPHGCHIYHISADMAMSIMCTCPSKNYGLPQLKYVLRCCDK